MVVESGVHPSLYPNCPHQMVFAKFNLMMSYPPPYSKDVCHYRKTNTDLIRRELAASIGKKPSKKIGLTRKYLFSMKPF